jgi:hypothetical protein
VSVRVADLSPADQELHGHRNWHRQCVHGDRHGPVNGTFDGVINAPGNSSVHVPDLPVISGTFTGDVDLSLAILYRVPLGGIRGTFTIAQMADPSSGWLVPLPTPVVLPFQGTFRMPFAVDTHGKLAKSDRKSAAFYLADDLRTLILIRTTERSLGFPTVRLEVSFGRRAQ